MIFLGSTFLKCVPGKLTLVIQSGTETQWPDTDTGFIVDYNLVAHMLILSVLHTQ